MPIEYPPGIKLEHIISFTFPGIFSAITLFMIIDYLSPLEFISAISKDFNNLIIFLGLLILFGTILGIIIDGMHHSIIEDQLFDKTNRIKKLDVNFGTLRGEARTKIDVDTCIKLDDHVITGTYCYSEFYSNTFLALIPFSIVVPYYLAGVFSIDWDISKYFGIFLYALAFSCLLSSYEAYAAYKMSKYAIYEDISRISTTNTNQTESKTYNINITKKEEDDAVIYLDISDVPITTKMSLAEKEQGLHETSHLRR